ncbi:DUF4276 family protein [Pseudofrankia sp. DC12]|uniref:DUF4276 family protein n=1 Tax=Pseudofrankia sp. DC12 TaxID=683315 RepID=UPI0005F862C2|nr:DUF4276 family protein [Pseudofrankia sp. DC12]
MSSLLNAPHVGLVVEGPGDAVALPVLLRRHLEPAGEYRPTLGKPVACNGRDKALMANGVEGKVAVAASRPGCRAVMVVLDADRDPSCQLGPTILARASKFCAGPVFVALAEPTLEEWPVASAETLAVPGLVFPNSQEPVNAIKKALAPAKYVKPTWQPRLAGRMDIALARGRSPSLDRILTRFDEVRAELR